jgi:hypothetical protein
VVASDLPRAVASAALLAPGRAVIRTPLLREAPLETPERPLPRLAWLRLPLRGWALVLGARWLVAWARGAPPPGVDARALARRGWRGPERRPVREWSAWRYTAPVPGAGAG